MEYGLNIFFNRRQPHFFQIEDDLFFFKLKTNSIHFNFNSYKRNMKDDLKICKRKMTLTNYHREDNLSDKDMIMQTKTIKVKKNGC